MVELAYKSPLLGLRGTRQAAEKSMVAALSCPLCRAVIGVMAASFRHCFNHPGFFHGPFRRSREHLRMNRQVLLDGSPSWLKNLRRLHASPGLSREEVVAACLLNRGRIQARRFALVPGRPANLLDNFTWVAGPERPPALLELGDKLVNDRSVVCQT